MISYIRGRLEYIGTGFVIIDNNGIGYNIQVTAGTQSELAKIKSDVKIYTYMNIREDGIALYGFTTMEELNMFSLLITVSGVGPKGALSMLDALNPQKITLAVIAGDIKTLSMGQGIGKKTAQRIALELKDKVKSEDAFDVPAEIELDGDGGFTTAAGEAAEALLALGFGRSEAVSAVSSVYEDGMDVSKVISLALKAVKQRH